MHHAVSFFMYPKESPPPNTQTKKKKSFLEKLTERSDKALKLLNAFFTNQCSEYLQQRAENMSCVHR